MQDQTLRFPMTKVTASHLSAVWNTLIERLDVSEMFSVGFWFLEQIGKDATKDLGLCYCFVGVYRKNPSQVAFPFFLPSLIFVKSLHRWPRSCIKRLFWGSLLGTRNASGSSQAHFPLHQSRWTLSKSLCMSEDWLNWELTMCLWQERSLHCLDLVSWRELQESR